VSAVRPPTGTSFNGRTPRSGRGYRGSNPCVPASSLLRVKRRCVPSSCASLSNPGFAATSGEDFRRPSERQSSQQVGGTVAWFESQKGVAEAAVTSRSMTTPLAPDSVHPGEKPSRYVAVLFIVSTVSLMDRHILAILLEPIKRELGASDTEMGLLTGFAFVLFFALASVPIARLADRHSRRNIIAVALAFWSVMTMLSGFVATFLQLAAARIGLGISEAAATPASASMLSDLFPKERRTTPLALLAVAAPVGTMLAFTIGGIVNAAVGWRMTFVALGAPGLLLTVVMLLTIREPRRGATEAPGVGAEQYGLSDTIGYLWRLRSLRWLARSSPSAVSISLHAISPRRCLATLDSSNRMVSTNAAGLRFAYRGVIVRS
jgi:hypothetical protein